MSEPTIRYASVCSGVEAASLAWEKLDWKPVWFSEVEPFLCKVLAERILGKPYSFIITFKDEITKEERNA